MMRNLRKQTVNLLTAIAMVFVLLAIPATQAHASSYTEGNQTIAVINGIATLTVNGAGTKQLTAVARFDGGRIDKATGIVYVIKTSNSIYAYSYELQKGEGSMVYITNGVIGYSTNGTTVTGYETSAGIQPFLTLDQFKALLNGSSTTTTTVKTVAEQIRDSISVSNNVVTFKVIENGTEKTYTLPTASVGVNVVEYGVDANNTIWVRFANGKLMAWNYDLQKSDSTLKMIDVTDSCTGLIFKDKYVTGYYVFGNSAIQPIWTVTQIKEYISSSSTNNNSTPDTNNGNNTNDSSTTTNDTNTYVKYSCVTGTVGKNLRDSNHKIWDHFRFNPKTGKASYKGHKYTKVRYMFFIKNGKKGQVVIAFNNSKTKSGKKKYGKTIVVDKNNNIVKTIKNVVKFKQDKGFAVYAVKKNYSTIKLAKF